ncbi:MAG: hypothetical protein A2Y06_03910 [Omnitrophica WOR_2 bacterium GWA2_37_7]|nr:MAG: hypothetical protein A2Y06_03910 [Omnitrophica WOR_2 bacterium GWA2_37_7]OGX57279.1 MAG: hypothetical protein A2447_10015 [Omnitrophica WOR_2 bacterium RIFOXYC2_FULL_38_12]
MPIRERERVENQNIVVGFGEICSVNISEKKGIGKTPVRKAVLIKGIGIQSDAHSAPDDETRQVSFLALESIEKQKRALKEKMSDHQKDIVLMPGSFAENITTKGIDSLELMLNDIIEIAEDVVLQVSRIGKECPAPCSIFYRTGDCIMPREGFFARVLKGGAVYPNSVIKITRASVGQSQGISYKSEKDFKVLNAA